MTLVQKIKSGGAGIWGVQVISPHPELSESDAQQMVRYILSLDTDESKNAEAGGTVAKIEPLSDMDNESLIPGCVTEAFIYNRSLDKIPAFDRMPDMAGIMPNFGCK